jgi:hypothetical protein
MQTMIAYKQFAITKTNAAYMLHENDRPYWITDGPMNTDIALTGAGMRFRTLTRAKQWIDELPARIAATM